MKKFDVFIDLQDKRWKNEIADVEKLATDCKDAVVLSVRDDVSFLKKNKNFAVNLALSDDKTVWNLNKKFRGIDRPTNVLSFASIDDPFFETMLENENDVELGDVIIAYETLSKEADELSISLRDHFCHLWVHGFLHILGYDHIKENERLEMEAKEIEILKKLDVSNPYDD
ncbi:MAG: rRNA maturation RNase YbeY [Alphaproteobacteria bacterium]|nr:rRNA maturation RNase YbeY [Alphaproteobacteria bacterium]